MKEEKTILELDVYDSAFVLRSDGSQEAVLGIPEEDEEISNAAYLVAGLSIAFVHHQEKLQAFVDQIFEESSDEE